MSELTRVLLVEDDEDHAELARQFFEIHQLRCEIEHVAAGEAALEFLRAAHVAERSPAAVLLDLNLPGLSGHEVLARVKQGTEFGTMPILVLTTSAANRDRANAKDHGADAYLTKPLESGHLDAIGRLLWPPSPTSTFTPGTNDESPTDPARRG